jgi:hypothetical protein
VCRALWNFLFKKPSTYESKLWIFFFVALLFTNYVI